MIVTMVTIELESDKPLDDFDLTKKLIHIVEIGAYEVEEISIEGDKEMERYL